MTEVPEHLLRRSKERRAALGGGGESAPAPSSASQAVEPSAAAAPAPAGGDDAPAVATPARAEPAYTGPPQPPPRKQRVPAWAMPVLAALPLWAVLYGGAFGERKETDPTDPIAIGAGVYRSSGCSGCHGPSGGGGVGPQLNDVVKTFPAFADHLAWVENGSAGVKGQPYGAQAKVANGGMPGFKDSLSPEELKAVVCHERVAYAREPPPPECSEPAPNAEDTGTPSAAP